MEGREVKTQAEIDNFDARARTRMLSCELCGGASLSCMCRKRFMYEARCFEACIPESFWWADRSDVHYNCEIFDDLIVGYVRNVPEAHRSGAGLFLYGTNGCGKSMFLSYILTRIARSGKFSCYYTTMPQLAKDISSTWNDRTGEAARRLAYYQSSDFVVIDELGKDSKNKLGDSHARQELERWSKERFDKVQPTLWASNVAPSDLEVDPERGGYGETIISVIEGRCNVAGMEPGDFRKDRLRTDIGKRMGWST